MIQKVFNSKKKNKKASLDVPLQSHYSLIICLECKNENIDQGRSYD